ncbi:hypothetical protein Kisp02_43280 [Kineosporia sp. NBRC 101731]|nr:hypothetical protein Kisp02_43280 [Kineosporia sp. NBRC 101731]
MAGRNGSAPRWARTRQPPRCERPTSSVPPQAAARSRIPISPYPLPVLSPSPAGPLSWTSTSRPSPASRSTTSACSARACTRAFVSDSCTIRTAARSTVGSSTSGEAGRRSSTGIPRARIRAAVSGICDKVVADGASAARSTFTVSRMAVRVRRPSRPISRSVSRNWSGRASTRRSAACARITTAPM